MAINDMTSKIQSSCCYCVCSHMGKETHCGLKSNSLILMETLCTFWLRHSTLTHIGNLGIMMRFKGMTFTCIKVRRGSTTRIFFNFQ